MNLARAFVDHRTLAVPVKPPDGVFVRVAVRTVNLNGITRRTLGGDGREPFREPGLLRVTAAFVLQPARTQPQQPRRLIVRFHLRNHLLHELMLCDFHAERMAFLRVADAGIAAGAYESRRAGSYGVTSLIEREH